MIPKPTYESLATAVLYFDSRCKTRTNTLLTK